MSYNCKTLFAGSHFDKFFKLWSKTIDIKCLKHIFIVVHDLVNIGIDTKITEVGEFISKLRANPIFMAAILILNFDWKTESYKLVPDMF